MNKKAIFLSLVIGWFLGAGSILYIWQFRPMHWHGHHMHERLYKDLQLTPEQRTKVEAIFKAGHEEMGKVFAESRAKMEAVRNTTRTQIRQLLSPEQQATFDNLDAKWGERFKKHLDRMFEHH